MSYAPARSVPRPERALPIVRQLSYRVTPALAATPLTPNAITIAALLAGLSSAAAFARGTWAWGVAGAALLLACYVLDNCDGELARLKSLESELGRRLDTAVDWLVHAAFFGGLGLGVSRATGEPGWAVLGALAALGATFNFWLGQRRGARAAREGGGGPDSPQQSALPATWRERALYVFRELSRADFCFIVLLLALLDYAWVLLPAGAVGAQVYWITGMFRGADRFHV